MIRNILKNSFPCFVIMFVVGLTTGCRVQKIKRDYVINQKMDSVILKYDDTLYKGDPPVIVNDSVQMSFWGEYNDTVQIIFNGIVKTNLFLNTNDYPYDGFDFSGKNYSVNCKKGQCVVILRLLRTGRYVQFNINRNYPVCNVNRVNEVWYITNKKGNTHVHTYRVFK
jgi:hypothetical protein